MGVVAHAFNSSIGKAEVGDLWVQGQPGDRASFRTSKTTQRNPVLEKTNKKKENVLSYNICVDIYDICNRIKDWIK